MTRRGSYVAGSMGTPPAIGRALPAPERPKPLLSTLMSRLSVRTTPGRLRAEMLALVVLTLVAGLLGSYVTNSLLGSTQRIENEAEPAILNARQIQTSLAEANAAAANGLVTGGLEDPTQRTLYTNALAASTTGLEKTARLIGDDDQAHESLQQMTNALARYSGMIEAARANYRQGLPVGSAYLNEASELLTTEIYPNTDLLANRAAAGYRDSYDGQRGASFILGLIAVALVLALLLALAYVQLQLYRRFRRTLNIPLALATLVTLGLMIWLSTGLLNQAVHLTSAREDGYLGTRLYLDARGIGFGAKADEARFLIARGGGSEFEDNFAARAAAFEELLVDLELHAGESDSDGARTSVEGTTTAWFDYVAEHNALVAADRNGEREVAVTTAKTTAAQAFNRFDEETQEALAANQETFRSEMEAAGRSLAGLRFGILVLSLLIAALTVAGLQQRINEYR